MNLVGQFDAANERLYRDVAYSLVGVGPLPPPLRIGLTLESKGPRQRVLVQMQRADSGTEMLRGLDPTMEVVSVTGCFRQDVELATTNEHLHHFREWSCSNPSHPLAVRYQTLAAWLAASRVELRFLALARRFVDAERLRQQNELTAAMVRLYVAGDCQGQLVGA